ncbi:YafY family protein [Olivibacter ginsenosidimutans]|uniref:YafY family protein n=1 Tax=Olivibacter ginsenosidimutans TaxID=1176537 RepID=A0ABP9CBV1_9SPHI
MIAHDSPKRFDRIVAIFIQLQSKRVIKAQELAERFGVSLRTIYRDIKTLEASGVPIYSEAGIGYSLIDGYRLPPVMFTQEEATSFVAAEKLMQKFTDKTIREHFASAMYKVRAVLRNHDKDWVADIESKVIVKPTQKKFNDDVPHALSTLFESIARRTQVDLLYEALEANQPTARTIEPVGVFHQENFWYVIAYCHLRNDYRQFRIDRIKQIRQTETPFSLKHQPLDFYLQNKEQKPTTRVRIRVNAIIAKYLKWERHYHGFVKEERIQDQVELTFEVQDLQHGFARWYIMFGDKAEILEPPQLKVHVKELLEQQLQQLTDNK